MPNISISEKVAHVQRQKHGVDTHHTCHWPGCNAHVPSAAWGCKRHWFMLPKNLRDAIWQTYRPGQEVTKTPSREYLQTAKVVQEWIKRTHGVSGGAPPPAPSQQAHVSGSLR